MNVKNVKAVIMAGGRGSRLMPITKNIPKPLVPVCNRPVINYTFDLLAKHNINDVTATVCYMPEAIIKEITNYNAQRTSKLNFKFCVENEPLGTAGSVRQAADKTGSPVLVISGDALTDINLTEMLILHMASGAAATMAVKRVSDPSLYGVVVTDESGYVSTFVEKPPVDEAPSDLVNCGIYVLEPEILECIPPGAGYDFARNLFPYMLENGYKIMTYADNSFYWCDIGNADALYEANMDLLHKARNTKFKIQNGGRIKNNVLVGRDAYISSDVRLGKNVVLGDRVSVRGRVFLSDCIVMNDTYADFDCAGGVIVSNDYVVRVRTNDRLRPAAGGLQLDFIR